MTLAILCPGQGAQHPAMFDLLAGHPRGRDTIAEANAAAGFDMVAYARTSPDIFRNAVAQPLICVCELAAWAVLAPLLPAPPLIAGYSVGELAAYGCAGSLTPFETVRLAGERAALMDAASREPAGLVALRGLTRGKLEPLCTRWRVEIAIANGEEHFIVGGLADALTALAAEATQMGASAQRLPVAVAAHTSLLADAAPGFRQALERSSFANPSIPVLAGVSGSLVNDRESAIDVLSAQLCTTVLWSACMDAAFERGCRVFLELGPGNALARMMRDRFPEIAARSVSEFRHLDAVADWVGRNLG